MRLRRLLPLASRQGRKRWLAERSSKVSRPTSCKTKVASKMVTPNSCKRETSKQALLMRFSNENSYLNWARNGVLSTAVGVAMYAQEHHRGAQLSGAGLMVLGFGYIGMGTVKYVYYIVKFRSIMELTTLSAVGKIGFASTALAIWLGATACFLETIPLQLDTVLLSEPVADYLPHRIRQGLIETYSLYLDDLEAPKEEEERVFRALREAPK